MFGLFKKKISKTDKLTALIKRQTAFSVKGLALHRKLTTAAPDQKKAIFEAFLFNNWVSFHLITRDICASLPASAPQASVEAIRDDIAQRLISAAQNEAASELESKFQVRLSDYCKNFPGYAKWTFSNYDSSVSRHETPASLSAAIRLGVCAELPMPDFSDKQRAMEEHFQILGESGSIFNALEDLIGDDVHDYLRTK